MTQAPGIAGNITPDLAAWNDRVNAMLLDGARVAIWGCGPRAANLINTLDRGELIPYIIDPDPARHGRPVAGTTQHVRPPDALVECGPIAPVCVLVINHDDYDEAELTIACLGLNAEVLMVD